MKYVAIIVILFAVLLFLFFGDRQAEVITKEDAVVFENGLKISVEIADEPGEWSLGLMNRQSLGENSGMLFVFPEEQIRNFWMKNTLIPLDMIFVDSGLEIVDIKNAVPCQADPCQIYASSGPAKYVIEVNSGISEKNGIRPGQKVKILRKQIQN